MNTRRKFIKVIGTGAALSSFAFSPFETAAGIIKENSPEEKSIRIGIIGAENGHTIKFGKLFNIERKFPGVEVKYVWGETDEFAKKAAENGKIPDIIKDPMDMMGKIDALVVNHRHPKYHLKAIF
jgi:maltose-binding protein MalE